MLKKLAKFFRDPPAWFVGILWAVTIGLAVTTLVFAVNLKSEAYAIAIYCLLPCVLAYTIYTIVISVPKIKVVVIRVMSHTKWTKRLSTDYGYRASIFSGIKTFINIAYALYNVVVAVITRSFWYYSLAAGYIILSIMRFYVVDGNRKQLKDDELNYAESWRTHRNVGVALIVYAVAFTAVVTQMVVYKQHNEYAGYLIYGVTGYTIYKVAMAISNVFLVRRYKNPTWQAIRNIILVDALVSLFSLQNSLFAAFAKNFNYYVLNAVSGGLVCAAICVIGAYMVITGNKNRKEALLKIKDGALSVGELNERDEKSD